MTNDHQLACDLAEAAGVLLLKLRAERGFSDAGALRDAGDASAHELLMERLTRLRPDDAVLSEEGKDDAARLSADRVWIVDPLDGTREFGEEGRTDWAVHVALWVQERIDAAAVALPALGMTLGTAEPPPTPPKHDGPLRIAVSRSRAPEFLRAVAAEVGAKLVPMGSAGAKVTAVVRGEVDAYLHSGGQYEWDSAAPVGVALAAGLHCSRLDGSPLRYNQADPYLPDLLVCRTEDAERLVASASAALANERRMTI